MANHYSALKRQRQNEKRAAQNRAHRSRLRHQVRELRRAIAAGDNDKAKSLASNVISEVDKSQKKGIIKENTARRLKSRLSRRLAAAPAAPKA